jgi:4-hydroxybenzoate polyprenyltransferase
MDMKLKRAVGLIVLLFGYTAVLAGLVFGLRLNPIVGVLLVFSGMALSICTAIELIDGFGVDPAEYTREQRPAVSE